MLTKSLKPVSNSTGMEEPSNLLQLLWNKLLQQNTLILVQLLPQAF